MMYAVLAASGLATMPASAQQGRTDDGGAHLKGWAFVLENDLLGTKNAKDRWYTNGLQLMLAFEEGREPEVLKPTLSWGRWMVPQDCEGDGCNLTLNTVLGQNIYTPREVGVAEPQTNDRPWAGWLYGGIGLSNFNGNRHQMLAFKAGPTGPASLAEGTQKAAHCCLGSSKEPMGWDNQLRPRLGVQLSYLSTHYHFVDSPVGLQTSWGGAVGNVHTFLRGAVAVTWSPAGGQGRGLQSGGLDEGEFFTPDFSAHPTRGTFMDSLRHTVFYAHMQVSAVAYNVFLEGRTYKGHSEIDPERLVGTSTVGFVVPLGEQGQHKLGVAWKRRTPEFEVRGAGPNRDRYQSWGVLSYSHDL
ncbi:hypothetical protein AQB9606_01601 [Aquabacterium sp. CECT 9606]|nr:hypothetical protein AQB9606_01601 [Aquabacterium sp. CECT 9606]